ncbi:hypothetical protein [Paenibacillus wulumuqiensis]|uniref:hypothetical protein n=1 Tax=Paenibacillus wulumuqiensis TaxID=1567107 RepID=UPI0006195087|nr:hypothetical protein [Paenibacillus wulumuqiensis]
MKNVKIVPLIIALLGSLKLILAASGIEIPDATIDATANGVAAVASVVGIVMSPVKKPEDTSVN